jgi:hypothetical protein
LLLGWERRYTCYAFMTSALDVDEWLASRPGHALPIGKGPHPVLEARWASELVWAWRLEEESFPPAGDRTLVVQSVFRLSYPSSLYTQMDFLIL